MSIKLGVIEVERLSEDKLVRQRWQFGFNGRDFRMYVVWYCREKRARPRDKFEISAFYNRIVVSPTDIGVDRVPIDDWVREKAKQGLLERVTVDVGNITAEPPFRGTASNKNGEEVRPTSK